MKSNTMRTRTSKALRSERSVERFLMRRIETSARVRDVATFEDAGVLTMNRGLVITTHGGREYQVTIVRSR